MAFARKASLLDAIARATAWHPLALAIMEAAWITAVKGTTICTAKMACAWPVILWVVAVRVRVDCSMVNARTMDVMASQKGVLQAISRAVLAV